MADTPTLTMVIGGATSGKSSFAEQFVIGQGGPRSYIATAQAFDPEMEAKIASHKFARADDGWHTVEAPVDIAKALDNITNGPVLIDCATMWLSNLLLAEHDIDSATSDLLATVKDHPNPITVVTNEVGHGVVPDNALSRKFTSVQGRFNSALAAQADCVFLVTAGLPLALKGTLP